MKSTLMLLLAGLAYRRKGCFRELRTSPYKTPQNGTKDIRDSVTLLIFLTDAREILLKSDSADHRFRLPN